MSSVSAACIFGAYSASSAHTDTFYIVSQIVRVRNSKRHFFSKLTFPYIIQPLCFTLRPYRPQPLRFTLRPHRPQPLRFRSTATSTTTAPLHPTATSTTTAPLHPTVTSTTTASLHPTVASTTARHFAQQSRFNSSAENFSYFFKTAKNVLWGAPQNGCNLRLRKSIHYNEGQELKVCLPQCLKLLVD